MLPYIAPCCLKHRPNDHSISKQHIATSLCANVVCAWPSCCNVFAQIKKNNQILYSRCCVLCLYVALCWPMLRYVAQCCAMLPYVAHVVLSPGQTKANFYYNLSQYCKTHHVALVWPPCCDVLRHVTICCLLLAQI